MSALALGVVADDVTGACDLAGVVTAAGMPATVLLGPPSPADVPAAGAACVVVALKTRTAPVESAVAESVAAGRWLLQHGARRLYQKYCSTFDSTPAGNIGPVADALAELVGGRSAGTPATPAVGRTVYQGHLFVDGRLLSESPLRDHPLTPMTDADLVRVLGAQTQRPVGLVPWPSAGVTAGVDAVHVLLDALTDEDLDRHAAALVGGDELLGGASGLAAALARHWAATEAAVAGAGADPSGAGAAGAAESRGGRRHDPPGQGGTPPYGRAPTLSVARTEPPAEPPVSPGESARSGAVGESARSGAVAESRGGWRHDPPGQGGTPPYGRAPTLSVARTEPPAEPPVSPGESARSGAAGESARSGAVAESRSGRRHDPPGQGGSPPYGRALTPSVAQPKPAPSGSQTDAPAELPGPPAELLEPVAGLPDPAAGLPVLPPGGGRVVLAGSCSRRTLEQVAAFPGPVVRIAVDDLAADPGGTAAAAVDAVLAAIPDGPVLVSTALPPEELRAVQRRHGRDRAAALAEEALSAVARAVVAAGVRRLIVAGGETSGAVTAALGVRQVRVGAQVAPGVPWTVSTGPVPLALLLKSGNFGPPGLFTTAWEVGP